MATFNLKILKSEINRIGSTDKKAIDIAFEHAQKLYDIERENLIQEFNNHKITQEIEAGPYATNSVIGNYGNLFSFIGFNQDDTESPTQIIRQLLRDLTKIRRTSRGAIRKQDSVIYKFLAFYPNKEEIYNYTPMPFNSGYSWVKGIETGNISGINYYLFSLNRRFATSRSGPAIQLKNEILNSPYARPAGFSRHSYISEILNNFKKRALNF